MKITPKARFISLIVALVFVFGSLIGTGTYLIINHINNSKALQGGTSIGNIFNGSSLNSSVCATLIDRIGNSTGGQNNLYSGTPIVFTMAGRDWQVVYRDNSGSTDIITVWMTEPYTSTVFESFWTSSTANQYTSSDIYTTVNNYYNTQLSSYSALSQIVVTPNDVSSTYKTAQAQQYTEGNLTSIKGVLNGTEHFWLPSLYETFSLWGLDDSDRGFDDTSVASYCWLRSGNSNINNYAMRVNSSGSANNSLAISISGVRPAAHLSLTALYEATLPSYNITVQSNNNAYGTVSGGGTYKQGKTVTLTAKPNPNYRFVRWERNGSQVSTSASYTFTVSGSYTYTAIFERATATISTAVSPAGTGTATGGGTYNINSQATLTAIPINGYKFVRWTRNGSEVSKSASYTFTVSSSTSGTYTAVFTPCTVSVSSNNDEWGTATYSRAQSGGIYSDQVTLTATAKDGYRLDYWLINGVRNDTAGTVYTFTITQDTTAVAYFKRSNAFAAATLGGEVRIDGNDLGTGTTSQTVTYTAIPYTGYYLIGWYVGDTLYTENGTIYTARTLTLPRATAEGVAVVPIFSTNASATPSLSFDLDNSTAITASIGGQARIIGDNYFTADTVTVIATVQTPNYRFIGWYVDGVQVSTSETTTLSRATVLGKIIQARFAPIDNANTNDDIDNGHTDDFV